MDWFAIPDWHKMFSPSAPLLEIVIRGSLIYLGLFALLRLWRREAGSIGTADLLVVVLIADAAQNALAGEYKSIPDGLILVSTIVFWSFALDWLGYHYPWARRVLHPPPRLLVRDGQFIRRNMRRELISEEELLTELREQGAENLKDVKRAALEGDGRISVLKKND